MRETRQRTTAGILVVAAALAWAGTAPSGQTARPIGEWRHYAADLASTLGAMESFTLPRTGIVVGYPKARILRPNGDATARGVVPDVAIATPVGAPATDVVLERLIERMRDLR